MFHLYLDPFLEGEKNYLALEFVLSDAHVKQAGAVSPTAFVEGEQVGEAQYTGEGRHEFGVEVPESLTENKAHVNNEFRVDPPFHPGDADQGPKGVIALGAGGWLRRQAD